ncbi:MAG: ferrous iron transport protein B [Bacteroidales bacterium]|mgnify:CR=1 FL=1|nr:ferrous iron transport protein B [Bacteroidales bacterium]HRX30975.1 ferrous iron transport protein B [Tenuifilaceae bacterium]
MLLSDLHNGEYGIITKVKGRGAFRKRITEMGFIKGKKVLVVKNAPLKDPIEYSILGYEVSLRRSEASLIEVVTTDKAKEIAAEHANKHLTQVTEPEIIDTTLKKVAKDINIALVGNPNAGKTTIFNYLSGSREHVGNYSGVTVESKMSQFKYKGYTLNITDLPGTYSLTAYTPEEVYVRKYIHEHTPDIVVNVVDASNLERNLYLTTQLIDMDIRVVIALNMYDELQEKGDQFDYKAMGRLLGIPTVPTVGSKSKGLDKLLDTIINVFCEKDKVTRHIHINYGADIEKSISTIQQEIKENVNITVRYSSRYLAIKLIEKDRLADKILSTASNYDVIVDTANREIKRLESIYKEDTEMLITDAKYGFIAGALKETYTEGKKQEKQVSRNIDKILTHKYLGFPIFLFLIWFTFYSTFNLGKYPMGWIESGVEWLGFFINKFMPTGPLKDLLVNGIISGVGSVIVFLPNILILFFFISLLEDTGYMARTAFIMDKLMHKIGLHGKSFIPLVMGFGCNVPAIMASRTIENRNNRLVTMLITPFMSCSARLPVYILILGAFFPAHAGNMLFLIYLIGILLAIGTAILFKKTIFRDKDAPFVMELPPYRLPTVRSTLMHMWEKGSQYLKKMGGVILVAVIFVWALGYYPQNGKYTKVCDSLIVEKSNDLALVQNNEGVRDSLQTAIQTLTLMREAKQQENSYLGRIGKFIEPAIRPLGFDWKMGVSLLSGVAAKEIVVSTLGVLYQADNGDGSNNLAEKLRAETHSKGKLKGSTVFTPVTALSFLIFILVYFPCVAVISAIKNESGSWKWALFTIIYTTSLAWVLAYVIYHVGNLIY